MYLKSVVLFLKISRVFLNVRSVLSQCNKRLKLLCLLYDIDFTRLEKKQQSKRINKLAQFNTTKVLHASSSKLSAALQRTPSQISSKEMFFAISNKRVD